MRTAILHEGRVSARGMAFAGHDEAESEGVRFAGPRRQIDDSLGITRRADDHESDAHVEGAKHLFARNGAVLLEQSEERRNRPRLQIDFGDTALGQRPRQILGDPAAGDVGKPFDQVPFDQRPDTTQVRPVRREQRLADGRAQLTDERIGLPSDRLEKYLPRERIPVGVQAG